MIHNFLIFPPVPSNSPEGLSRPPLCNRMATSLRCSGSGPRGSVVGAMHSRGRPGQAGWERLETRLPLVAEHHPRRYVASCLQRFPVRFRRSPTAPAARSAENYLPRHVDKFLLLASAGPTRGKGREAVWHRSSTRGPEEAEA